MLIINADGLVLGRMASYAAKRALLGEKVIILNAEKALLSKSRKYLMKESVYKLGIQNYGNPRRGPFLMKRPDNFVRRVIRGMLPYSKNRYGPRGREAFKRIFVFIGIPDEDYIRKIVKENVVIDEKNFVNLPKKNLLKYTTVGEFCKMLGSKI